MAKDRWDHKPADPAGTDPVDRDKVDLEELWEALGVVVSNGTITFDENAELAAIRRAITRE